MFFRQHAFLFIGILLMFTPAALAHRCPQQPLNVADVRMVPPNPTPNDVISAQLSGVWSDSCVPFDPKVFMPSQGGQVVFIQLQLVDPGTPCLTVLTPWSLTVSIGRLPEGDFQVAVLAGSNQTGYPQIGYSLISVSARPARGDDHNDSAPVESGYAVITPATTSGMVVFATFGFRQCDTTTTQAAIVPSDLTTNAILFVNSNGSLQRNLGVALTNPGSASATVTLTLWKDDGRRIASKTISVSSRQQIARFITELFSDQTGIPSDLTGALAVTSTSPLSVIGLRFRGENFSTVPVTNLSTPTPVPQISTGIGGMGAVLLPQFTAGGGWATEIVIANPGSDGLTVRVDLFKPDGTSLMVKLNGQSAASFSNLTVPARGVLVLAPRDSTGNSRF
jgi:hypothetical protein